MQKMSRHSSEIMRYQSANKQWWIPFTVNCVMLKCSWEQPCKNGVVNFEWMNKRLNDRFQSFFSQIWAANAASDGHTGVASAQQRTWAKARPRIISIVFAKTPERTTAPQPKSQPPVWCCLLCWQKSRPVVEGGIVNMHTFNPPYPTVRPGCVPETSIIVCNEKLE